ncbi:cyclin-dependent kinase inhibitor 4 [Cajanus cajan]|uniref:Cyclin-dependent kinase inhibitor n=1 Tax=Cajanus cajan TaxID=3821 RepID=A0A151S5Z1_CAJCA|nr:cyclin-dependent kinase inhibitor 4 [Cajanus cajan]KYP50178.1 Cyclin-dependent kinase inhibitor 3 [Cajanus cajan]
MGKYIKKSKIAGDVAAVIMEAPPPHSSLGVRTRAKTLALQNSPQFPDPSAYLQLRSRRLLKLPPPAPENPRRSAAETAVANFAHALAKTTTSEKFPPFEDDNAECSFGENFLEVEGREERSTRESTPCSLIRDSNAIHTPGSTTRQRTRQIIHERVQRNIPSAYEMEEFFAYAEKQQQTIFMDKYNFDIVNEVPLPGRYEWVPVLH